MKVLYSNLTRGFYMREIHGEYVPPDAIVLVDGEHARALDWQTQGGAIVGVRDDGAMELAAKPELSSEQVRAQKLAAIQAHLDALARARGFRGIFDAVTFADEPAVPKFQAEGKALRAWRSLVWEKANEILEQADESTNPMPTDSDLIAALPQFVTPAY